MSRPKHIPKDAERHVGQAPFTYYRPRRIVAKPVKTDPPETWWQTALAGVGMVLIISGFFLAMVMLEAYFT